MNIEQDAQNLTTLSHLAMTLIEFSRSLRPGEFKKKSAAWIYYPNFVGLEMHHTRTQTLNLLVRRIATKVPPEVQKILPLRRGHWYSRAKITNPLQLLAACTYIEASWRDWHRELFQEDPTAP